MGQVGPIGVWRGGGGPAGQAGNRSGGTQCGRSVRLFVACSISIETCSHRVNHVVFICEVWNIFRVN